MYNYIIYEKTPQEAAKAGLSTPKSGENQGDEEKNWSRTVIDDAAGVHEGSREHAND